MEQHRNTSKCRGTNRAGKPCGNYPVQGATVCVTHGGRAPQVQSKAQQNRERGKAQREYERIFGPIPDDAKINPRESLLQQVTWKHYEVARLRAVVQALEVGEDIQHLADDTTDLRPDHLVWGITKSVTGTDPESGDLVNSVTKEARMNIWVQWLHDAEKQLRELNQAALRAGIEERQLQVQEHQAQALSHALNAIFDRLQLSQEQQGLLPTVVPEELRRITAEAALN